MSEKEDSPVDVSTSTDGSVRDGKVISKNAADITVQFLNEHGQTAGELTPEKLKKLKWKLWTRVLLLVTFINFMLFVDKSTMSYAALLGFMEDTNIGNSEYNNLNTLFYTGYVVGQIPGHLLIQRLPLKVYITGTIFTWALLVLLHDAAFNYGGLIPLRFLLGATEATMVPALEITLSMFFVPEELHEIQPLFWTSCVGNPIVTGLISYGLLFSKSSVSPWKFFMIITGGTTLLLSVVTWFIYPSNPATAGFLSTEEKVHVIQRVHNATRSSIEQKTFKKYQFYEALHDPVSWCFAISTFCLMLSNNLAFQLSLLYVDIGVSNLGSTLVWVAAGGFAIAVLSPPSYYDSFLATVRGGLFCGVSQLCRPHEKLTRNGMYMAAYGISNIISPQMWKSGGPRYYGTWVAQIVLSFTLSPILLLIVTWILSKRNKDRCQWIAEQEAQGNHGVGFIEQVDEATGETIKVRVDVSLLDLTDLENKFFIYPL